MLQTMEPRGGPTLELDFGQSLEAPAGHGVCSYHQPSHLRSTTLIVPDGICAGPSASTSAAEIIEAPAGEGVCSYHQHKHICPNELSFYQVDFAQVHLVAQVHLRAQEQQQFSNDKKMQVWLWLAGQRS